MLLIISVLIGMALDLTDAKPAAKNYASKYDHIDVGAILNNRRMVNYYSACLLSQGACPPEGVELKRILPEALQTNCARCSEKQATIALMAIKRLKKEYPKIWSELSAKWDPSDSFVKKFETTFESLHGPGRRVESTTSAGNKLDPSEADGNTIDANITQTSPEGSDRVNQPDTTTTPQIITTNPSFSTSTKPAFSSTKRPSPIPGLVPFNTFFTNPPIPIRPIVNLNLGGNIGATVKAIKQVEKMVADIALEKIGIIRSILRPWRKAKKTRYA
uniref:Chemosensory protein 4 n=1 Tax=Dendroctonus ponderosae TaxID=77166 RepID=A0A0H3W5L5_DENPD|nr:chemosensory protein 4 [Dendroctonus ponderosae]